jgi:CRP-like cAMP-binding protein
VSVPPLFSAISEEEYARILSQARERKFGRGELLFIEGDPVEQIFLITSGFAKVTQLGSGFAKVTQLGLSGVEVIFKFAVPGDVLGATALFAGDRHSTSAQACRACRAYAWEAAQFKSLLEMNVTLSRGLVRVLVDDMLELEQRFREVATERAEPRVARQLVRLLERAIRSSENAFELPLLREELAQMTGTTVFTISRILSEWERHGIIKRRRDTVTICGAQELRAIAAGRAPG